MNYKLLLFLLLSTAPSFCANQSSNPNSPQFLTFPELSESEQLFLEYPSVNNNDVWDLHNSSQVEGFPAFTIPIRATSPVIVESAPKRALTNPSPSYADIYPTSPYSGQGSPNANDDLDNNTCDICKKSFPTKFHLLTHQDWEFPNKTCAISEEYPVTRNPTDKVTCTNCTTFFKTLEALEKHRTAYPDGQCIPSTQCDICKRVFGNPGVLTTHKNAYRDADISCATPLECKECGKVFKYPSWLKEHEQQHERAKSKGNQFTSTSPLRSLYGK